MLGILVFPTITLTYSSPIINVDRGGTVETSEDGVAAIGIQKESAIQVDSSGEKLVDVKNNIGTEVTSTVSLETNIGWDFQGSNEKSKLISTGQSKQFFVDIRGVSPSESRGNYTVKSVGGSFYLSSNRTVEFVEGGFEATVGSNLSVALIKKGDNIESKLIVTQSDGFKKTDTTFRTVS